MLIEIPGILSAQEARMIRERLQRAAFIDGKTTAGYQAARVKNNLELPAAQERMELSHAVTAKLAANPTFNRFALVRHMGIPLFSRYDVGMAYGVHSDDAIIGMDQPDTSLRNDLALTLFLSEPDTYDGGELSVMTPVGRHAFKPAVGTVVVYPSHYLHEVRPVTRGVRFAAVNWLQSYVRDAECRAMLYELSTTMANLRRQKVDPADTDAVVNLFHKLLRLWGNP